MKKKKKMMRYSDAAGQGDAASCNYLQVAVWG